VYAETGQTENVGMRRVTLTRTDAKRKSYEKNGQQPPYSLETALQKRPTRFTETGTNKAQFSLNADLQKSFDLKLHQLGGGGVVRPK